MSFIATNIDLIDWKNQEENLGATPWQPRALNHDEWPPNYIGVYAWRMKQLEALRKDATLLKHAKAYYAKRPAEFIMHWMDTYNPRKQDNKWIPFVFFSRQLDYLQFLEDCRRDQQDGLTEKCRDAGVTWLACGYSVHSWLFIKNDAIGWGSRKQDLVDKLGNPDSIFEKMRLILSRLPDIWRPKGYNPAKHATFMRFVNPETKSVIMGEAGDNIGRGGRTSIYFKDEAQPLDSKILTPDGWLTMADMQPGIRVVGASGQPVAVTNINNAGVHSVYRVSFTDGTSTKCSENHLWTVDSVIGKKKRVTLRTSEMLQNFKYFSPGGQTQFRYRVPLCKPVQFSQGEPLPLHPYIVGVLIGDGSVNSGCITFTSADVDLVVNVAAHLPENCKITKDPNRDYSYRIVDVERYNKKSVAREIVKKSGIYGKVAHEKFIPDSYKFASVDDRFALLQGLMDTDGSASGGQVTYHTTSKKLADDVRFVVQSLGGVATFNIKQDHRGYRDVYCLTIIFPENVRIFRLFRKQSLVKSRARFYGKTICSIEFVGIEPVRCITVDSMDGLYLTDHCIVTHNSAHYERPEKIESALSANTNVQIDISSVNGLGNVFHRKREAGVDWFPGAKIESGFTRVFVFDWSHHPEKTKQWYDERRAKFEREGLLHIFAQEVERNYSAAVSDTLIPFEWVQAAVDAHKLMRWKDARGRNRIGYDPANTWLAGLDVADGGIDRNALAIRQDIVLRSVEEWGERDTCLTTRRAVRLVRAHGNVRVMYDNIGVGSGVKAEYNRVCSEESGALDSVRFIGWNAGAGVVDPYERMIPNDEESILNRDMFDNMKAQAWWSVRTRFYKTFQHIKNGVDYKIDEMISIDSTIPLLHQLMKELAQPTKGESKSLKTIVNKKPPGTKSPNLADSVIMAFFPIDDDSGVAVSGRIGGG